MSEEDENNVESYSAEVSVGQVSVSVSGEDPAEVDRLVDEKLERAVSYAERLGLYDNTETYYVEGGAGRMEAHGDADSPEQALENWEYMWEKMLEDVEELSDRERGQAGLKR